jgi:hypothetical protein
MICRSGSASDQMTSGAERLSGRKREPTVRHALSDWRRLGGTTPTGRACASAGNGLARMLGGPVAQW